MRNRARGLWLNLSQSLGFIPGIIVAFFAVVGVVLVQLDQQIDLTGVEVVFKGDSPAARVVLSVIAGSLITVAGLTFSITMVVLQLASRQFSPRLLRTFFGDRVTQITIGTYVGTFVYSILVLRSVGSFGDADFVPRLSITFASLLGIAAVVLLVVFLHHVSQMVQVSHVTASVAHATLGRLDALYPEMFSGSERADSRAGILASWRAAGPPGRVFPARPGYVQRVGLDDLATAIGTHADRAAVLVCPGDFVSVEMPIVEVWPASALDECLSELKAAVTVASERDLDQDIGFGTRQLTDTALKSLSPGINDPMTAVTCIGYLRSILVRVAERATPDPVRAFPEQGLSVFARHRAFGEHLDSILQINRYVSGDAWVAGALLEALHACELAATRCGATERAHMARSVASTVAAQAIDESRNVRDREQMQRILSEIQVRRG